MLHNKFILVQIDFRYSHGACKNKGILIYFRVQHDFIYQSRISQYWLWGLHLCK